MPSVARDVPSTKRSPSPTGGKGLHRLFRVNRSRCARIRGSRERSSVHLRTATGGAGVIGADAVAAPLAGIAAGGIAAVTAAAILAAGVTAAFAIAGCHRIAASGFAAASVAAAAVDAALHTACGTRAVAARGHGDGHRRGRHGGEEDAGGENERERSGLQEGRESGHQMSPVQEETELPHT